MNLGMRFNEKIKFFMEFNFIFLFMMEKIRVGLLIIMDVDFKL